MRTSHRALPTGWLAVGGFGLLFILTVILFLTPSARGYEISIYEAYPWYFWVGACLALLVGNVVIVRSADEETAMWVYGLLLVLAVVGIVTLLPYFRGYALFGRADVLTHLGFIKDIQNTSSFGTQNIYPNIHLLVLSLAYATGVEPQTMLLSVAGIASMFAIVSILALLWATFGRRLALLSIPFATVIIGVQSVPYLLSSLLVPFVLYLFVRERTTQAIHFRAALATVLFSLVMYHPITTLFVVLVMGIYGIARALQRRELLSFGPDPVYDPIGSTPLSQLLVAVFAVWYLDFPKIVERFGILVGTLLGSGGGTTTLEVYSSTITQYTPAVIDLVRISTLRYGPSAILLGAGALFSVLAIRAARERRADLNVFELTFVGGLVLFGTASVAFLAFDLLVGFGRPLLYADLFGALLAGSLFGYLSEAGVPRRALNTALYLTVAVLIVVSTFGLYTAPAQIGANHQVTQAELDGTEWYLETRNDDVELSELGIRTYRYKDALYGRYTSGPENVVTSRTTIIPAHFNYTEHETLGASYEEDHYLVLSTRGRVFYEQVYPDYREFWSFEPDDFEELSRDETVSQVYSNGGYDVYRIYAVE